MLTSIAGVAQSLKEMVASSRSVKNVIWNLIGGLYAGVLIVIATPLYVSRLGLEGYGILGLWLMMQVMMGLLDVGMGATLIREFADSRNDLQGRAAKRDLLRTLEWVYWTVATLLCLVILLSARPIATHWLQSHTLSNAYLGNAIRLMAVTLGLQFPCVLYTNGMAGLQEHGRMNALQILGNTLRYGLGVAVLFWRADLVAFFAVQAGVAGFQTLAIRFVLWRMITDENAPKPTYRVEVFRRVWKFSLGMAATAIASVLLANADRIALSKMMPTAELGKYAIAFTATGLLQMGIQPFYRAFFPRYAELVSTGEKQRLRDEYFRSCRLMAAVIIPLGVVGWLYAPQLFHAWLSRDDQTIVAVFRWLLLAITCSGLMWLPAAFQQAHGTPGLHAGMIIGALLLGIPTMVWAIWTFGTVGATAVWLLHGVSGLTLELWIMHKRLLRGELALWYRSALVLPVLITLPLAGVSRWLLPHAIGRLGNLCWIGVTGLSAVAAILCYNLDQAKRESRVVMTGVQGV